MFAGICSPLFFRSACPKKRMVWLDVYVWWYRCIDCVLTVVVAFFQSYDKAAYHSATPPPPFGLGGAGTAGAGGVGQAGGYPAHLYIQHGAMPPPPAQHQVTTDTLSTHTHDAT